MSDRLRMQERQLELISESIERIKGMGTAMEKEVKEQNELASDITKILNTSQTRTETATSRVQRL